MNRDQPDARSVSNDQRRRLPVDELIAWDCPMADKVLANKCKAFCDERLDYEYCPMTLSEFDEWKPTTEDVPCLVESIRFWADLKPRGDKVEWSQLQFKLYCEAAKKEKMLLHTLGKVKDISNVVVNHLTTEKRNVLRKRIKKKIKTARVCRT